jgi:uncharacterized protein (DUF2141 family)
MEYIQHIVSSFCLPSSSLAPHFTRSVLSQKWLGFRILGLVSLLFVASCARQGSPSGGPKDTRPPEVDTLTSTPNYSTRFEKKRIELKFDEWVVLSDVLTQVVVSPPLAKRPEVVLKGKTVVLNFDKAEVLRPNTTYTVNFGTAVKDLRENNPAKDLRFVFSTGDFIDSLEVKGFLADAFTGDPVENISILLYENFADSAVRKERPYYFSRTDKTGQFTFQNLKSGRYRLIALDDMDQNLKWDGETERIGFRDSALWVQDSMREVVQLKLYKNRPTFRLVGQNINRFGLVKLGFNQAIDSFEIQTLAPDGLRTLLEKTSDSLMLWYDLPVDTAWSLLFSSPELRAREAALGALDSLPRRAGAVSDTILIRKISRSDFLTNHRIGFGDVAAPASTGRGKTLGPAPKQTAIKTIVQVTSKPAALRFNYPIVSFDTSQWRILVDSIRLGEFLVEADTASPRLLWCTPAWIEGKAYTIQLLPGAITDFWGQTNMDTLTRIFNVIPEKQLGVLSLTLDKLRPGINYVLQILSGTEVSEERKFTATSETEKLVFKQMQVASYTARLVEDLNGNNRWDTGNFNTQQQPERVFSKKLDALRANWELEATFSAETSSLAPKDKIGKQ